MKKKPLLFLHSLLMRASNFIDNSWQESLADKKKIPSAIKSGSYSLSLMCFSCFWLHFTVEMIKYFSFYTVFFI